MNRLGMPVPVPPEEVRSIECLIPPFPSVPTGFAPFPVVSAVPPFLFVSIGFGWFPPVSLLLSVSLGERI